MNEIAKLLVGPEGLLTSKIAAIGEAPGRDEVIAGRPFVGAAGKETNKFFAASGIARSDCYLTNVIKERPPNNDISKFIVFPKNPKKPVSTTKAYDEYEQQLYEELSKSEANVFVPFGNIPLYALTRLRGITKYRGSILSTNFTGKQVKVIPIIHPAATLPGRGQYEWKRYIVHDLVKIKGDSEYPELNLPKRDLKIKPSYDEVLQYIEYCKSTECLAFDIEIMNEEVSCISISPKSSEAMSIPFFWGGRNYLSEEEEIDVWRALAELLQTPTITKLAQLGTFDATFLFGKYGIRPFPLEDTHIQHSILYPELPRDLGFLCSIYTREPYYKDDGKVWSIGTYSDEDFAIYNAKDSAVLHEIFQQVSIKLKEQGNTEAYQTQCSLIEPITYMTEKAIRVDSIGMKNMSDSIAEELDELEFKIEQATDGIISNPASAQQVMNYFYIHRGIKPYLKKGRPTGDEDALKRIAKPTTQRKGYSEAALMLRSRYLRKLKGTYLDMKLDPDGRLRSAINPGRTVSGRLASKKTIFGTGADIQNQHSEMKPFILSDKGYIFCRPDLAQGENRIVAYIAPEPTMIGAFERGIDCHAQTGALMSGLSVDEVKRQDREGIKCALGNGQHTWRDWGKSGNHGVDYGEGYKTYALKNDMTEAESKRFLDRLHLVYPGIRKYHNWIRDQLKYNKTLTNCFGRSRVFTSPLNDDTYRAGYNFIPQSTIGYKINKQGILYIYYNRELFSGIELLNQVHDDVWFQWNKERGIGRLAECVMRLKESFDEPLEWRGRKFIIPTDFSFGYSLADCKANELKLEHISSVGELESGIKDSLEKLTEK